ncbi:hypothetical protein L3X38_009706 [Prunus dulcis]|uniref:Uncharacterized protein n=1 Tax=Prunus dulcis TaxID=3755 RepID=A0AAD4WEW3_PRUDU|nr:hypothetical protein L3X38_009706 [Prunus dulcis]
MKIFPRHTVDNLRYVGGLKCVLVGDASISFADLRCQLPDEGVQNADASGDCEKNEDEDDFSFAPDGSSISTDNIFQNGQIRPVFSIFNRNLLFSNADDNEASRAKGASTSSSYLQPSLNKLFFEERDTTTSATSFYNSRGGLGS